MDFPINIKNFILFLFFIHLFIFFLFWPGETKADNIVKLDGAGGTGFSKSCSLPSLLGIYGYVVEKMSSKFFICVCIIGRVITWFTSPLNSKGHTEMRACIKVTPKEV